MLFHVTISHTEQLCPGRRPDDPLDLITPSERLEVLGHQLSVASHYVLWSASCMLWAEPEHVAYALLEGPNLDAVLRYVGDLTPAEWTVRALPVFNLPRQSALVRHVLMQPAMAVEQAAAPPSAPKDEDGGQSAQVAAPPVASSPPLPPAAPASEPKTKRGTLPTTAVVVAPVPAAAPVSDAVTRFIERPALIAASSDDATAPNLPPARSTAPVTDLLETIDAPAPRPEAPTSRTSAANEPAARREVATLILKAQPAGLAPLRLLAVAGPAQNAVFEVGEEGATIGRLQENPIHLSDGRLSRQHARIDFEDGEYWIRDLDSANGTVVNGQTLSGAHRLQPGDAIELGISQLTVMDDPEPTD